jgi:hypothetical protein
MEAKTNKDPKPINYVHKATIHNESIGKERKFENKNFKSEFTLSPYTCNL